MVPAGEITEQHGPRRRRACSRRATRSSTAATPTTATTSAAPASSREQGIDYIDCGTSGGVFGLDRGYCLMIGGPDEAVERLDPIFKTTRPRGGCRRAHPGAQRRPDPAENGYLHCGPNGAGHFVKMVHNGIEYGIMAAYAEGLNILKNANAGKVEARDGRRDRAARAPRVLPVRPRHPRGRRGLAARQRGRLLAARPDRRVAAAVGRSLRLRGSGLGLRRGPLDLDRRDRGGRAAPACSPRRCTSASPRATSTTSPTGCSPRCATSSAGTRRSRSRWRTTGSRSSMTSTPSTGAAPS